jgi:nitroimidazol reductase NimA-like FMN-containing flavoprotein (pyridoxamine 5'-phosphate oxidase superfamily)
MQELTWQDAERILERNHRGRLACFSPTHDRTYVVPMSYRFHDGSIYLAMMPGQKLDFLHEHPQGVSFEVDEITNDETWLSVVATGVFVDIKGSEREDEEAAATARVMRGPLRSVFYESRGGISQVLSVNPDKLQLGAIRITNLTARQDNWSWDVDFPIQLKALTTS